MKRPMATFATRRLSTRIVTLFLALLLLVQLAGLLLTDGTIMRTARAALGQDLGVGERVWHRLLQQKADGLVQGATVLAADYGFRSAVASGDVDTLGSALDNSAARIGATLGAWIDTDLQVKAVHDKQGDLADRGALRRIAAELARSRRGSVVATVGGHPYQFVAVPVKAPLVIGWVMMGFPIDAALIDDMRALSGLHVALLAPDARGALATGISTLGDAAQRVDLGHGDSAIVAGEEMMLRRLPLAPGSASSVVLMQSVSEAVAPYRKLQGLLLLITAGGVAVFAVFSVFTARAITTPLQSLVRASERLGRGDYTQPVGHTDRHDEIGELAQAFDLMRTNIAAQAAEVRQLAYWDRLTGLPNRAQFRETVQAAMDGGAHGGGPLSVLMLDLDRFKRVNDVLGYRFGDLLLQAVAERIVRHGVREGDLVARLSGDEFALLLPGADAARALAVAQRIAEVFEQPLQLEDQTVDISAGFGIACWPAHAGDADALISRAEVAMYAAKRKTASALVYDPAIDAGSAQTLSLLSELRRALEQHELRLFLQPKIALASGRLVGAEALVRWQHPTRGMVPPMQFIPFAEQTGFVRQLTLWMFEAAAAAWPRLAALGIECVSVNLSTRDLLDAELPAKLGAILARQGMLASAFCLEITESAIMDEPQRAHATLDALSAAGFKLSIDDYGTGYSSLQYVAGLPVDELKIDKGFVMSMLTVPKHAAIVRSTIELAHTLGLSVVAEGVESAALLVQLRALDCDEAQGYHMSRPVPVAELESFAERWRQRVDDAAGAALH